LAAPISWGATEPVRIVLRGISFQNDQTRITLTATSQEPLQIEECNAAAVFLADAFAQYSPSYFFENCKDWSEAKSNSDPPSPLYRYATLIAVWGNTPEYAIYEAFPGHAPPANFVGQVTRIFRVERDAGVPDGLRLDLSIPVSFANYKGSGTLHVWLLRENKRYSNLLGIPVDFSKPLPK